MTKIAGLLTRATRKVLVKPDDAWLLLRMAGWVALFSTAVKLFSLPRALRFVSTKTRPKPERHDAQTSKRLANAIDLLLKTNRGVLKPVCWKRAAVLHRYLALNGSATRIVFGMRRESDGSMAGHAWLEAETGPIFEATTPDYVVTYFFPSNEPAEIDLDTLH